MAWNKIKVRLSMGMSSGGGIASNGESHHQWRISVDDDLSGTRLLSIELTPDEFARALGHHYLTGIKAEILDAETFAAKIGKRHDVKTVLVRCGAGSREEQIATLAEEIKPLLVDGWTSGSEVEKFNWHHYVQSTADPEQSSYRVALHWWVDPSTPEEPEESKALKALKPKKVKQKAPKLGD